VPQIALVSDQHDNNVGISVIAELLEPSRDVLVGLVLADVVDEESADGATVVCRGDGAVSLLAGGIPDLSLDGLRIDLDRAGGELDADGGLGIEVELVAGESTQKVGLSDTRVTNKHHYCQDDVSAMCHEREKEQGMLSRGYGHRIVVPLKRNCAHERGR